MASDDNGSMLVVGNQRSYSDVCRNGITLKSLPAGVCKFQDDFLRINGGYTLYEALAALPVGWTIPVMPGTGWATIGGCIANDVHGKNHQTHGSFGNWVQRILLKRSDGIYELWNDHPMFAATIGGLGLTGEIVAADIKCVRGRTFKPWLFPLDYIPYYWPLYKRLRFWQYHCIVPESIGPHLMAKVRQWPLLLVRKRFGNIPSVGMLSFCRPGISISMDFARKDDKMQENLDWIVMQSGGAVYPAKTSMSSSTFRGSFKRWREFAKYVDPKFSSDFWRRVNG